MAHLIVQGGANLYKMDLTTGVATQLTLPTGITLSTTRKPRFAVLNQWTVMTNSPTRNLAIDPEGEVRVLVPRPPTHPPTAAAGAGTGLTGDYLFAMSHVLKNDEGELLMESPLSSPSPTLTLTDQNVALSDIEIALDEITARRIYRTLAGGSEFFKLMDLEGNTATAVINGTSDASLELLPAHDDVLVAPPGTLPGIRLKNIVEWKSRLWAVADTPDLVDTVFVTETNKVYAWPNRVVAHPTGVDELGIVGFAPRKDQLGLVKRNGVWRIGGASSGTGIPFNNISVSQIAWGKAGSGSPDTIVVEGDRAWWLGNDGVYEWSGDTVKNITDDTVRGWFTTDTYFNRARFPNAFAKFNKAKKQYELHLAALGSSTEDRWVAFNIENGKWYGPHRTALFTPSHATSLYDANGLPVVLVGGTDGVVYTANSLLNRDGASTAIDFDAFGPFHHGNAPDIEHFWGEFSVLTKIQGAGTTLTITPYVGRLDASAGTAFTHDMTLGRELLGRLGDGALARLRWQQSTVNVGLSIFGYEIPFFENGRR